MTTGSTFIADLLNLLNNQDETATLLKELYYAPELRAEGFAYIRSRLMDFDGHVEDVRGVLAEAFTRLREAEKQKAKEASQ